MKNVILLTIDTLRKDAIGCYGNKNKLTPFIDSLEERCIKFTNMQAIGPYTQASFPGILASSYYLEYGREKKLSSKKTLISEVLKKAGITTAAFHSNPYLCNYFGWNRGWDIFYDSMEAEVSQEVPYVKGNEINQKARERLSAYTRKKRYEPFFLWLHYMDVHEPYIPQREYVDLVDSSICINQDEMFILFKNVVLKRDTSNSQTVELLRKLYNANVRETDEYVKGFFTVLEELNLLEDSIIIVTSDHGEEFGEHGGLSHDGKMYSELIDVPLLIYDYDRVRAEVFHDLVSNVDISPTIIHLFDLKPEESFQGHSLLPLKDYPPKGCFGEAIGKTGHKEKDTDKPIYFYRENDLKIIYREGTESWEMYDLKKDPEEFDNIVKVSPKADEMKRILEPRVRRWLKD